ncbi:MAG: hypothetical protein ACTSVI_05475 [Promethearchaeota archaeon]
MLEISIEYLPQIIFEASISMLVLILSISLYRRWIKKRTLISRYLSISFLSYFIATLNTVIVQLVMRVFISNTITENMFKIPYFLHVIIIMHANWYYFKFFKEVYNVETIKTARVSLLLIMTVLFIIISLIFILTGPVFIIYIFLIIQSFMIYIPSIVETKRVLRKFQGKKNEKRPFESLYVMSWFFILVWINMLAESIFSKIFNILYSPPFYFAWFSIACAAITAYLGFIYPRWFQKYGKRIPTS